MFRKIKSTVWRNEWKFEIWYDSGMPERSCGMLRQRKFKLVVYRDGRHVSQQVFDSMSELLQAKERVKNAYQMEKIS